MRVVFLGHSSFHLTDRRGLRVLIDPFPDVLGLPFPRMAADVVVVTHDHFDHNATGQVGGPFELLRGPVPAVVGEVTFSFYPCFHDDARGVKAGTNQIVRFELDGLTVCHLGDLGHLLNPGLAALLHGPALLFVPVGGCGSTLDAVRAGKVVAQLEPHVVVPMHYREPGVRMQLDPVDGFLAGRRVLQTDELELLPGRLPERRTVALLERVEAQ